MGKRLCQKSLGGQKFKSKKSKRALTFMIHIKAINIQCAQAQEIIINLWTTTLYARPLKNYPLAKKAHRSQLGGSLSL